MDFTAAITEAKAELEAAVTELPALRAAHQAAEAAARDARYHFNDFVLHYSAATRGGRDHAAPALERMLDSHRRARDAANGAATRAKREVESCEWRVACARDGLAQLERAENPSPVEQPAIMRERPRPKPADTADSNYDVIVFPVAGAGRSPRSAA
jgi:hypothetical protein